MSPDAALRRLYLVDGTSQLFRAYYALPGLTNADGLPTNAVYGFTTMLRKLMNDERPPFIGVAFDTRGPVFRHADYAEYKANRPPAPEDLNVQVPHAKRVCEAFGIPVLELAGYEADDLIATIARHAREAGFEVVVVASDKDLLQLVGDAVSVLNPSKNVRLDAAGVAQTFGVPPERVRDVLGLMGDSVDNVPGVPGVGQKTALAMVATYGGMDAVLERAGRFVSAFEGRDAALSAIDDAAGPAPLAPEAAGAVSSALADLDGCLARLLEVERDTDYAERLRSVRARIAEVHAAELAGAVGRPGREALKALGPLRRELKQLDRASAKRAWLAVAGHREQALLSRQLVTLHDSAPIAFEPAKLERGPGDPRLLAGVFRSLGFDSLLAEIEAGAGPAPAAPRAEHDVVLSEQDLGRLAARCREAGQFAVAVETEGIDPQRCRLVGLALACGGRAAYVPVGHAYLAAPEQLPLERVRRDLGPLFADPAVGKVGHDLKHVSHVLRRHGLAMEGWKLDTLVAAFLLDASRSRYAIEGVARAHLGRGPSEEEASPPGQAAGQEVERAARRGAGLAALAGELAETLDRSLHEAGLRELYDTIDGPLLPVLARMEATGIRVDTARLEAMSREMERRLAEKRAEIHALAGLEFNVDSPRQVGEVLFDRLELRPRRRTAKSRAPSTDAQTLEELAGEHEIAARILEYRELAKLKGTYVDSLPRLVNPDTGRVHTSFHPAGAATGRLSSSDPNLQNIPVRSEEGRRIREAFVPAEGCVFLASDYSQIELRILAHVARDPELIAAFLAGEDIHRHTASRVFDVHADLVSDAMRRRAKAVNFGILYGMSESRLAREQGLSRREAQRFIETYFARFSNVRVYIDAVREQALRDGEVRTLFGRVRPFPQLRAQVNRAVREQALRAAVNTTLQGTAADLMKLAMLEVSRRLADRGLAAGILLQVHDELLLEVPRDSVDETAALVREAMENVHELEVPLVADQKVGRSWLEVT
jgi:DNA polymerase-1